MATKPTRLQVQARDDLAAALNLIAGASRLNGREMITPIAWAEIASRLARVSSAFPLDEIVARALELRGLALGIPASTAEILTLVESKTRPLDMLLLDDEAFRAMAEEAENL